MGFGITDIYVEYRKTPIGIDEKAPRFSWKLESDKVDTKQVSFQIWVRTKEDEICFDSGEVWTEEQGAPASRHTSYDSKGFPYEGKALSPCTKYQVELLVTDNYQRSAKATTWFETGFMNESIEAWEGAQWISAPEFHVAADTRGVFSIESEFRLKEGSKRAGIVFGANDFRLLDKNKNELGLEGDNYIRYEICLTGQVPMLSIYRVGYAPGDNSKIPYASVPLVAFYGEDNTPLLTEDNKYDFHTLKIVVEGNASFTYFDGTLVDAEIKEHKIFGKETVGRVLNPRGFNDVLTYPRLNEIGFFAGDGDGAYFKNLTVKNLRAPGRTFIDEKPEGNLYGEPSIFQKDVEVEDACFLVMDRQITKNPSRGGIPMFRMSFPVDRSKPLARGRLYITARGIYDCRINGVEVTDRLLPPGMTQYDKRMNYQTYDITDKISQGKNGIGVTLSSGWWSDAQTFVVKNYNYFGDKEALLAKIVVEYQNGEKEVFTTNTRDWKYFGDGPYRYGSFFLGEQYDARKERIYDNYSLPEFDELGWEAPVTEKVSVIEELRTMPKGFGRTWPKVHETEPVLIGGYDAPVYIVETRCAKSRIQLAEGVYLYDMEQEMAGVPKIHLREPEGTKVILRYAEVLYPDMPEYAGNEGKMMLENYRDATSTDIYICSGKEGEVYQPRFTYHGYRYIEISGIKNPPDLEEVESLQYSSVKEYTGSFESSNQLLNRFTENVHWSQLCNFINLPTDCPQRNERMGWAGDTHVFCHTALQNSNLKLFYERNLVAMEDLQTKEGQYPEIAPVGGGFGGITYECATIFIAWELFLQYGDIRTLESFYPGMKKYMGYMKDKGLPGMGDIAIIGPLGDWLAPKETDLQLLWNAFYYREAVLMEKIAGLLNKEADASEYHMLAAACKNYWNETFVDPVTKMTRTQTGDICDTQCSYVLGLEYGVMEDTQAAAKHLVRKTKEQGHTVGTGFFGTGLLNQALSKIGAVEDAYKLMLQTDFPSWLYPVTQGATTIWEHWDSYTKERGFGGQNAMNSFNHYSLGSVLSWLYSYVLGIRREEDSPGYRHFTLEPLIGGLQWAKGGVDTPYGNIWSEWEKKDGQLVYRCKIPVNTSATLRLMNQPEVELGSGEHEYKVTI